MNERQGTLRESSWVTALMLDTSKGHPGFHKNDHGGTVDVFQILHPSKEKKEAIHGHRINDTFLVEILVTVFSD